MAHLVHLSINHAPIFGLVFGAVLLCVVLARPHSRDLQLVAYGFLVFAGLAAIPTFLTGEATEEAVVGLPGVSAAAIEHHEAWATVTLVYTVVLSALALAAILITRSRKARVRRITGILLVLAVIGLGIGGWTAHLGGKIHRPEFRHGESDHGLAASELPADQ